MGHFIVYQATNTLNGKSYIGYTSKTLEKRLEWHLADSKRGSSCYFHSAIRKYGWKVFRAEVLCIEETKSGAQESEVLYILDKCPEYNMTLGGESGSSVNIPRGDMHYTRKPGFVHHNLGKRGLESALTGRKRPKQSERMAGKNNPAFGKTVAKKVSIAVSESNARRSIRYWGA